MRRFNCRLAAQVGVLSIAFVMAGCSGARPSATVLTTAVESSPCASVLPLGAVLESVQELSPEDLAVIASHSRLKVHLPSSRATLCVIHVPTGRNFSLDDTKSGFRERLVVDTRGHVLNCGRACLYFQDNRGAAPASISELNR